MATHAIEFRADGRELYWLDSRGRDTPVRQPVTERPESGEESVISGLDTEHSATQITL
jgi:hypothetical protein